jgi:hypothetical protein
MSEDQINFLCKTGFSKSLGFKSLSARFKKACKFPNKTEESIAEVEIVTASVTALGRRPGLVFLTAEYYIEGEAVANTVAVTIRAKLTGKYALVVESSRGGRQLSID